MKIKLITSYLNNSAGVIIDVDEEKAGQLVQLKRAEYIREQGYETAILQPKKKGRKRKFIL